MSDTTTSSLVYEILTYIFLFCLIFGLSATVNIKSIRKQVQKKSAILVGLFVQFIIMPVLGYAAVCAFSPHGLTQAMGMALLVVVSSPGGSYSNFLCSVFNAELALSVTMTTASSVLSVALLPANLLLYSTLAYGSQTNVLADIDFAAIGISLAIVIIGILSGIYAGYKFFDTPEAHKQAHRFGSISGLFLIIFSVLQSRQGSAGDGAFHQDWAFYVAVAFPCVLGLIIAHILSICLGMAKPESVAISIESMFKNATVGSAVALTMFSDPTDRAQAVAVPIFYIVAEAVVAVIYCIGAWKLGWTKAPSNEKFWTVIRTTYEVEHSGDEDGEQHNGGERDPSVNNEQASSDDIEHGRSEDGKISEQQEEMVTVSLEEDGSSENQQAANLQIV